MLVLYYKSLSKPKSTLKGGMMAPPINSPGAPIPIQPQCSLEGSDIRDWVHCTTVQRKKIKEGQCEDRLRQQWARGRVGGTSETLHLVTCVNKSLTATALLSATNPSLPSILESLL